MTGINTIYEYSVVWAACDSCQLACNLVAKLSFWPHSTVYLISPTDPTVSQFLPVTLFCALAILLPNTAQIYASILTHVRLIENPSFNSPISTKF